jgi:hypothetical protein
MWLRYDILNNDVVIADDKYQNSGEEVARLFCKQIVRNLYMCRVA